MIARTRRLMSFILLLLACLAFACNGNEIEKANQLVEAGNASVKEGQKLQEAATSKKDRLFDTISPEQYPAERDSVKGLAQEAADGFEKSAAKYREAAAKFDQASKLKIHEKLKEYLALKAQEFNKRAEQADINRGTPKAFMESDDAVALHKTMIDNKDRADKLEKEAGELAEKSDKIKQENKDIFKPDPK